MVICKKVIDPIYKNLLLPLFFEFKDLLTSATKNFLSKNLKTFDDTNKEVTDEMKDDIANVHTTTDPYMQINHDCVENNNDVDNNNDRILD